MQERKAMILEGGSSLIKEEWLLRFCRLIAGVFLLLGLFDYFPNGSEVVCRATLIYVFLIAIFRIAGRRSLNEATTMDLVLLLIISETVQGALVKNDDSIVTAMLLVITLLSIETIFILLKVRSPLFDRIIEGKPVRIVTNSKIDKTTMKMFHIEEEDILEAARRNNELTSLEDIKEAFVEKNGDITIIPKV